MSREIRRTMYAVMRKNRTEVWGMKGCVGAWLEWPGISTGVVRLYTGPKSALKHFRPEDGPYEVVPMMETLKIREAWE